MHDELPQADGDPRLPRLGRTARGILALIFVHFLLDLVLGYFSADAPALSSAIFFSLIMAQTTLLGMWGGLGGNHWVVRVAGVALGTIYLGVACGLGIDELDGDVLFVVALAAGLVMVVCSGIRILIAPIAQVGCTDANLEPSQEGLQFGIRHLMVLTLVVACLVSAIKAVPPELMRINETMKLTMIAICFFTNALATIWAMMGLGATQIRGLICLLVSGLMGWVTPVVIGERDFIFWASVIILQTLYVITTLAIVRQLGYRLLKGCVSSVRVSQ